MRPVLAAVRTNTDALPDETSAYYRQLNQSTGYRSCYGSSRPVDVEVVSLCIPIHIHMWHSQRVSSEGR